jgi:hypothetical protein
LFYFICGLFNDAASSLDSIALNDMMMNNELTGNHMEGTGHGLV